MTRDHNAKRGARARMRETGERYTQARAALYGPSGTFPSTRPKPDPEGASMSTEELLSSLDRDGYAVVHDVLPRGVVEDLRRWAEELVDDDLQWRLNETERRRAAGETDVRPFPRGMEGRFVFQVHDGRRELVADSVASVVERLQLPVVGRRMTIGACMPGWGAHEGLHDELTGPAAGIDNWDGAIFRWPLTEGWKGLRVVAGSHLRDPVFGGPFAGAIAPHPDEVHVEAEPGDVYNLHIWKSTLINLSDRLRCEVSLGFKRDEQVSAQLQARWASAEIFDGGVPAERGNAVGPRPQATVDPDTGVSNRTRPQR